MLKLQESEPLGSFFLPVLFLSLNRRSAVQFFPNGHWGCLKNNYVARNSSFLKIKHKIDFKKKLFNYENTGRKKEAGKNIRKSGLSQK